MEHSNRTGHLLAFATTMVWGTTFVCTKVLLAAFEPIEILFFRFMLGGIALCAAYPKRLRVRDKKKELLFFLAGLCGVTFYFLLENIALTHTLASNVGVIISVAPFFTALLSRIVFREERLNKRFFVGFLLAIIGISCLSFPGAKVEINPIGDLLAVGAAFVWACYSILTKKISTYGYKTVQTTRRIFFYGLLGILPILPFFKFELGLHRFLTPIYTANLLFLGLGASALCYVTWNVAVKVLGAVKTSVYIYLVPVVTVVTSILILHEKLTIVSLVGTVLTLLGLIVSERRGGNEEKQALREMKQ